MRTLKTLHIRKLRRKQTPQIGDFFIIAHPSVHSQQRMFHLDRPPIMTGEYNPFVMCNNKKNHLYIHYPNKLSDARSGFVCSSQFWGPWIESRSLPGSMLVKTPTENAKFIITFLYRIFGFMRRKTSTFLNL